MLILLGKCYELIPNDTLGFQTFKRRLGYYSFYSKNHINKIVFEPNNLHIMSNNVRYPLLNKLINYVRDLKFLNNDEFCITLVKNITKSESNEAKFIIYSNKNSKPENTETNEISEETEKTENSNYTINSTNINVTTNEHMKQYYLESF